MANTWYVKSDATGEADGTSWEDAFTTIAEALDEATLGDGDIISIQAGTYAGSDDYVTGANQDGKDISLEAHEGSVIWSIDSGTESVIRDYSGRTSGTLSFTGITFQVTATASYGCLYLRNSNGSLTFTDCNFVNPSGSCGAFLCDAIAASTRAYTFTHCTIQVPSGFGMYVRDVHGLTLDDCSFTSAADSGTAIYITTASDAAYGDYSFTDVSVSGFDNAILSASTFSIGNLTINGLTSSDLTGHAIYLGGVTASSVNISNMDVTVGGVAIHLPNDMGRIDIRDNTFVKDAASSTGHTVNIGQDPNTTSPQTRGGVILNNTLTYLGSDGGVHAVFIGDDVNDLLISGNTVICLGGYGLVIKGGKRNKVIGNTIAGNNPIHIKADADCNLFTHNTCYCISQADSASPEGAVSLVGVAAPASLWPKDNFFVHNILVAIGTVDDGTETYCICDRSAGSGAGYLGGDNVFDGNLYFAWGDAHLASIEGSDVDSLAALQAAWSSYTTPDADGRAALTTNDAKSLVADPLFIDVSSYDLRVPFASPARGAAQWINNADIGALQRAERFRRPRARRS